MDGSNNNGTNAINEDKICKFIHDNKKEFLPNSDET